MTGMDKRFVKRMVCLVAGLAVLACALCSLRWRVAHDVPILMYAARLMTEAHAVPYRDFFDMNLPGTYWMMAGLVRFFGCSDLAVRLFDLMLLAAILTLTFIGLRRWGRAVASLGVCLFALRYFAGTWNLSLQREYLALLPFSAVLAWMARPTPCSCKGGLLIGVLFAWMALIKPQLLLFIVPVFLFACGECRGWKRCARFGLSMAVGLLVPLSGCVVWLIWLGAWRPFLEIATGYWPLYGQMSGAHEVLTGAARWRNVRLGAGTMLWSWYLAAACLGLVVWVRSRKATFQWTMYYSSLACCSVLVPCLSGQFWGYHKIPFYYVTACLAALAFSGGEREERRTLFSWSGVGLGALFVVAWVGVAFPRSYREAFGGGVILTEKKAVPDEVAGYLKAHLVAGDRVQPLDWTGGAVQGMLMANALPATRFLYDFHFYHHVTTPFIQRIRQEFLSALTSAPPRYFVETLGQLRPCGTGTSATFSEFECWRAANYHVAESKRGYRIWERNTPQSGRE